MVLFSSVYMQPLNPLRSVIGYIVSFLVYIFGLGLNVNISLSKDTFILATTTGTLKLNQTFYEFLTIIALTIPLYLSSWRILFKKLVALLAIMTGYYVLLYSITILLLHNGFKVPWLLTFIRFNTESFMILAFGLIWYFINRNEILKMISNIRRH